MISKPLPLLRKPGRVIFLLIWIWICISNTPNHGHSTSNPTLSVICVYDRHPISYEMIYFNKKLDMLLDMDMTLPGFRTIHSMLLSQWGSTISFCFIGRENIPLDSFQRKKGLEINICVFLACWRKKFPFQLFSYWAKGSTGLDRKSAHPLLLNTREPVYCTLLCSGLL